MNDLSNFNEIFREDMTYDTYDNIKSNKKPGFHPLIRRYIFQKTTGGLKLTPPAVLGLKSPIAITRKGFLGQFLNLIQDYQKNF